MKKICTVLSSAFFAAAAFAGSTTESAPFTMDPPGGLVESLQTFKMTMQPESGVSELGFNAYSIYIEKMDCVWPLLQAPSMFQEQAPGSMS